MFTCKINAYNDLLLIINVFKFFVKTHKMLFFIHDREIDLSVITG